MEKFGFTEKHFEKLERGVFMRVSLHIEIDERAELPRAAQNRAQLAAKMHDRISRIRRIHLRVERGDFYGEIDDWKQLLAVAEWISPAFSFAHEMLEQIHATRGIFSGFVFAHDGFAQKIDREPNALRAAFAQRFHDVARVFSSNKLARHAGNVPAQDLATDPRNDLRELDERGKTVAGVLKVFVEMADDFAAASQRSENIDKAKHLHLEMLVGHGESHHALVKTSLAEKRFGVL